MFSVLGDTNHNSSMLWHSGTLLFHSISIMGRFTPEWHSNLHCCIFLNEYIKIDIPSDWLVWNTVQTSSNYPPILENNVIHFWTHLDPISLLYKAVHTRNLGIPAGLDNSENITPWHPWHLYTLAITSKLIQTWFWLDIVLVLDCWGIVFKGALVSINVILQQLCSHATENNCDLFSFCDSGYWVLTWTYLFWMFWMFNTRELYELFPNSKLNWKDLDTLEQRNTLILASLGRLTEPQMPRNYKSKDSHPIPQCVPASFHKYWFVILEIPNGYKNLTGQSNGIDLVNT